MNSRNIRLLDNKMFTSFPLFRNMTQVDIHAVLQCVGAFMKEYKKDEFIFLEEDRVQCVGCVIKGSVQMIREDIWGNKTVLITMGEKELFGESTVGRILKCRQKCLDQSVECFKRRRLY